MWLVYVVCIVFCFEHAAYVDSFSETDLEGKCIVGNVMSLPVCSTDMTLSWFIITSLHFHIYVCCIIITLL